MVCSNSISELIISILDSLRHMLGKSDDRTLPAQAAYKIYFEKSARTTKRFETCDIVFLDRQKHEPNTAKERGEHIAKSKHLTKSTVPFRVIWAYSDVIVVD